MQKDSKGVNREKDALIARSKEEVKFSQLKDTDNMHHPIYRNNIDSDKDIRVRYEYSDSKKIKKKISKYFKF